MREIRCTLLALVLTILIGSQSLARKWTDITGRFSIEAELVSLVDGEVTLRRQDGSTVALPLAKLSKTDQQFARSSKEGKGEAPVPAEVMTKEEREALRIKQAADKKLADITKGLGNDEDGYFLVAVMAKEVVALGGGGGRAPAGRGPARGGGLPLRAAPAAGGEIKTQVVVTYGLLIRDGRDAAAKAVLEFQETSSLTNAVDAAKLPKAAQRITHAQLIGRFDPSDDALAEAEGFQSSFQGALNRISPLTSPESRIVALAVGHDSRIVEGELADVWGVEYTYARPSRDFAPPLGGKILKMSVPPAFSAGFERRKWVEPED